MLLSEPRTRAISTIQFHAAVEYTSVHEGRPLSEAKLRYLRPQRCLKETNIIFEESSSLKRTSTRAAWRRASATCHVRIKCENTTCIRFNVNCSFIIFRWRHKTRIHTQRALISSLWIKQTLLTWLDSQLITEKFPRPTKKTNYIIKKEAPEHNRLAPVCKPADTKYRLDIDNGYPISYHSL